MGLPSPEAGAAPPAPADFWLGRRLEAKNETPATPCRQMKYEGGANPREGIIQNVFEALGSSVSSLGSLKRHGLVVHFVLIVTNKFEHFKRGNGQKYRMTCQMDDVLCPQ